jgi:hypothetical protein
MYSIQDLDEYSAIFEEQIQLTDFDVVYSRMVQSQNFMAAQCELKRKWHAAYKREMSYFKRQKEQEERDMRLNSLVDRLKNINIGMVTINYNISHISRLSKREVSEDQFKRLVKKLKGKPE